MSKHWKYAFQAALIFSVLLFLSVILPYFTSNTNAVIGNTSTLLSVILTFVTTFIFWSSAFPSEKSGPFFFRASWVGTLVPLFVILVLVIFRRNDFDNGKLVNDGTMFSLMVMLGALFIPIGICAALTVRLFQTRKMDTDDSYHKDISFYKLVLRAIGHLAAFIFVIFLAFLTLLYLTDDYVGQEEKKRISAMGYQFKAEIENYNKQNGVYPETLGELPTAQSKHFTKYRKWGVFGYRANGNSGYSLLWRYQSSSGIICSTDMQFWPGTASMQTEDRPPPSLNEYGCYAVNPEVIRKPPWL